MTKKPIIFIKIGGSLITDKSQPFSLKEKALEKICREIKKAKEKSHKLLIVGHGGGSFPHFPAKKYQTHLGVISQKSYQGIAAVQDAAARLNRIVVQKLIAMRVNAVSVNPSSCYFAQAGQPVKIFLEPIKKLLEFAMLPVLYGDVVLDIKKGCCILSTEKVLGSLALQLKREDFLIEKMIYCGKTDGVLDEKGQTIPLITAESFNDYQKVIGRSEGIDVTGGMIHKVSEALALAKQGIPGLIIDGITNSTLSRAVLGQKVLGTKITA